MDTPFMPAKVRSVMLKASSILKPGRDKTRSHVKSMETEMVKPSYSIAKKHFNNANKLCED